MPTMIYEMDLERFIFLNVSFLSESELFWRLEGQLIGLRRTKRDRSSLFSSRTGLERTQLRRRLLAFTVQHLILKALPSGL